MAKIARVVAYLYDSNGNYDLQNYFENLIDRSEMSMILMDFTEKEFEWSDDVAINKINCTKEEAAKFYRELKEK